MHLDITIDEFNALGFEYGDSCDITFSNGYKPEDILYYNCYYSKTGHLLISVYPGYPHIDICVNNEDPLWETVGLNEATIAKYIREQEAHDIALDKLSVKEYEDPFKKKWPVRTPFGGSRVIRKPLQEAATSQRRCDLNEVKGSAFRRCR